MIRLARAVTKRRFGRKRIGGSAVRGNLGRRPLPRPTAGLNGVTGREQDQGSQKRLHAGLSLPVGLLQPEAAGEGRQLQSLCHFWISVWKQLQELAKWRVANVASSLHAENERVDCKSELQNNAPSGHALQSGSVSRWLGQMRTLGNWRCNISASTSTPHRSVA